MSQISPGDKNNTMFEKWFDLGVSQQRKSKISVERDQGIAVYCLIFNLQLGPFHTHNHTYVK